MPPAPPARIASPARRLGHPRAPLGAAVMPRRRLRRTRPGRRGLVAHGAIAAVMLAYALGAVLLPTGVRALVGDDWVYVRSVETLLREGRLRLLGLSVATVVFQTAWGALFAALLPGPQFAALRVSTIVMTALGGLACYGLCRELDVQPRPAALAAAAYLFNPLAFVLAYSFMTDPHFTALATIALWATVRALRPGPPAGRWLLAGAAAAAAAFLVRQQGALLPPAILLALALSGRLRFDRAGLALAARVAALPAVAVAAYYAWLSGVHGLPEWQGRFAAGALGAGPGAALLLVGRMAFVGAAYVGVFALPVAVAALPALPRLARFRSRRGRAFLLGWALLLVVGVAHFAGEGFAPPPMPLMPYVPQYVGPTGLGPTDLLGGRPWLIGWEPLVLLTAIAVAGSLVWALLLAHRLDPPRPDPTRTGATVVACVLAGQALGTVPPSFHFADWTVSVDRYLLPLLPPALALGVWALRGEPVRWAGAWTAVAAYALIAVAGTRDFLLFQQATWRVADAAVAMGIPAENLDGGASWDGYHLYEASVARGLDQQTPGGPWWTDLFAPATDSTYVVATGPLPGYDAIGMVEYDPWLDPAPGRVYLLGRQGRAMTP